MFNINIKKNKGFTLVETMVAVFILSLTIISLMTVVSRSLFASRYSRDEITANYLLQESIDYIRNDRDSMVFLSGDGGDKNWEKFITEKYSLCFKDSGCYFDVLDSLKKPDSTENIKECNSSGDQTLCPPFYFNKDSYAVFYNYQEKGVESVFRRKIVFEINPDNKDEIFVEATVYWTNGDISKSRSLKTSLLRW